MEHTENNAREFEEFKKQQWEETMKLCEDLRVISVGNSPSSTTVGLMT
jgi:hypothetical protein